MVVSSSRYPINLTLISIIAGHCFIAVNKNYCLPYVWKTWGLSGDKALAHAGRGLQAPRYLQKHGDYSHKHTSISPQNSLFWGFTVNRRLLFACSCVQQLPAFMGNLPANKISVWSLKTMLYKAYSYISPHSPQNNTYPVNYYFNQTDCQKQQGGQQAAITTLLACPLGARG